MIKDQKLSDKPVFCL